MAFQTGRRRRDRRGAVHFIALIMLLAFATLGIAMTTSTLLELRKSGNVSKVLQARMAAESGMAYMLVQIEMIRLPTNTTEETLIANLATDLKDVFDGTVDVAPEMIATTSTSISIPEITTKRVQFSC